MASVREEGYIYSAGYKDVMAHQPVVKESVDDDLIASLQKEIPGLRKASEAFSQIDWLALKSDLYVARKIKDNTVTVVLNKKRVYLPIAQAETLLKSHQSNMRGITKYVQSRW